MGVIVPFVIHPIEIIGEVKLGYHPGVQTHEDLPGRMVIEDGRSGPGHVMADARPILTGISEQPNANGSENI